MKKKNEEDEEETISTDVRHFDHCRNNKQSMYCLHINRICTNNEYYLVIDLIRNIHLHRDTVINSNDQSKRNREKKGYENKNEIQSNTRCLFRDILCR